MKKMTIKAQERPQTGAVVKVKVRVVACPQLKEIRKYKVLSMKIKLRIFSDI